MRPETTLYQFDPLELLQRDHHAIAELLLHYQQLTGHPRSQVLKSNLAKRLSDAWRTLARVEQEQVFPALRALPGLNAVIDGAMSDHKWAESLIGRVDACQTAPKGLDAAVARFSAFAIFHMRKEEQGLFEMARAAQTRIARKALQLSGHTGPQRGMPPAIKQRLLQGSLCLPPFLR